MHLHETPLFGPDLSLRLGNHMSAAVRFALGCILIQAAPERGEVQQLI